MRQLEIISADIEDICKQVFLSYDLNFFSYGKCYRNGNFSLLCSNPHLLPTLIESGAAFISGYQDKYLFHQIFSFFWCEVFPQSTLDALESKGLCEGMSIVRRYRDYYEIFGYCTHKKLTEPLSRFLSMANSLEDFSNLFLKLARNLIKSVEQKPPLFSTHTKDKDFSQVFLPSKPKRYMIRSCYGDTTYATSQELLCIQLHQRGFSYKEIGRTLSISNRTVESYFGRLKQRTGYSIGELSSLPIHVIHEVGN